MQGNQFSANWAPIYWARHATKLLATNEDDFMDETHVRVALGERSLGWLGRLELYSLAIFAMAKLEIVEVQKTSPGSARERNDSPSTNSVYTWRSICQMDNQNLKGYFRQVMVCCHLPVMAPLILGLHAGSCGNERRKIILLGMTLVAGM